MKKVSVFPILIIIVCLCAFILYLKVTNNKNSDTLTNQEVMIIGEYLYNKSMDYYWCDFVYAGDGAIHNYNEITELFTSNGKLNFDKELGIRNRGGRYFEEESKCARSANESYMDTELKLIKLELDLIEFEADSKYCNDTNDESCSNFLIKTNPFILKKNKNIWRVDDFILPN